MGNLSLLSHDTATSSSRWESGGGGGGRDEGTGIGELPQEQNQPVVIAGVVIGTVPPVCLPPISLGPGL